MSWLICCVLTWWLGRCMLVEVIRWCLLLLSVIHLVSTLLESGRWAELYGCVLFGNLT